MPVYVVSQNGKPLMPSYRYAHVRILLKGGMAKVIKTKPFTIQLLYETTEYTQPLYGGTDPGRTNIGNAVLKQNGEPVYADHVETRNKQIPDLMKERAAHRNASRRGERHRRQRRAIKNGTITFPLEKERILLGCEEPIINKFIINSEARFSNRKRPPGWLTPTARQLVQTTLNMVKKILTILPVTDWTLEINRFAFMLMEDGTVRSVDFQNGRMKNFEDVNSYIYAMQDGKCPVCGKLIEHYHHIIPRSQGGSNRPDNIIGICADCHEKIHTKKDSEVLAAIKKAGEKKKYSALSVLNQAIPYIYQELTEIFGEEHIHICYGWQTKELYTRIGFPKTHSTDAICIAALGANLIPLSSAEKPFEVKQFRRHDRQLIKAQRERTYKFAGKTVAKNRKARFEQKDLSLEEFIASIPYEYRQYVLSNLKVTKSRRYYNNPDRKLPGTVFYFQNHRYVKSGQSSGGAILRAVGMGDRNFTASKCTIVPSGGLVYL